MTPIRKALLAGGLVATTLTGGAIGATLFGTAGAAETTTTAAADSSTDATQAPAPAGAPTPDQRPAGPHRANGIIEPELTGDDYDKAVAAATEAVPDGTVKRAETDAEGEAHEVHMTKADGSCVTVKLDEDFKVVSVEEGRPGGHHRGPRPGDAPSDSTEDTATETQS